MILLFLDLRQPPGEGSGDAVVDGLDGRCAG